MNTTFYLLLQINDGLFPIGSYAHSFGLETYVQLGLVHDEETAMEYLTQNLCHSFLYSELLPVSLAYDYASQEKELELLEIEEIMDASRAPSELREASRKLGTRFVKAVEGFYQSNGLKRHLQLCEEHSLMVHHAVAYGIFCKDAGILKEEALAAYLYSQTSAMVTNCVKLIPLSQTTGQQLLFQLQPVFALLMEQLQKLGRSDLCLSAPGMDIRAMQHETLYSRLYMS